MDDHETLNSACITFSTLRGWNFQSRHSSIFSLSIQETCGTVRDLQVQGMEENKKVHDEI
jgi:hypothetical protein